MIGIFLLLLLTGLETCSVLASNGTVDRNRNVSVCVLKLCQPQPCSCYNFITFSPNTWLNLLNTFMGKRCNCDRNCNLKKVVRCKNGGKCNLLKSKCDCGSCWHGKSCEKFVNPPKFLEISRHANVYENSPIGTHILQLMAHGENGINCKHSKCRCGRISYEVEEKNSSFYIEGDQLTVAKKVPAGTYVVKAIAFNNRERAMSMNYSKARQGIIVDVLSYTRDPVVQLDSKNEHSHQRFRRNTFNGNEATLDSERLTISAKPYLMGTYYFNKFETITFQLTAVINASVPKLDDIVIFVSSAWLDLENPLKITFDSVSKENDTHYKFEIASLLSGTEPVGNITGRVKENIEPLASLELDLLAFYKVGSDLYYTSKNSQPVVYSVFPAVNLTRQMIGAVNVYDSIHFEMVLVLPLLNFSLLAELTTNIEDVLFMAVTNVTFLKGSAVLLDSSPPIQYSSSSSKNVQNDRVTIDFGNVSVSEESEAVDRMIKINFEVAIDDDILVENGSSYVMGVGIQAGNNVLWVEQQSIEIIKNEPALKLTFGSTLLNGTRLYIGDIVTFNYKVEPAQTFLANAHNLNMNLSCNYLKIADGETLLTDLGGGQFSVGSTISLFTQGAAFISGTFQMQVIQGIYPLLKVPIAFTLDYQNAALRDKRREEVLLLDVLTAAPDLQLSYHADKNVPVGKHLSFFQLTILLVKMKSNITIEIVTPKTNESMCTVMDVKVDHVGSNIAGLDHSATAVYLSTTDNKRINDQARLNLGVGINLEDGNDDSNKINVSFGVSFNDHPNNTNGSVAWIAAGMVGSNKMVWVGQLPLKPYLRADSKPKLKVTWEGSLVGNDFNFVLSISHFNESQEYARNMVYDIHLPLFIAYKLQVLPGNVTQVLPDRLRFKYDFDTFLFHDSIIHNITAILDKSKCPATGDVTLEIPVKVAYKSTSGQPYELWRSYKETIQVPRRLPLNLRGPNALPESYERGLYFHDPTNTIYLCINSDAAGKHACYKSNSNAQKWSVIDARLGCILGHDSENNLYGIDRRYNGYLMYQELNWYYITKEQFNTVKPNLRLDKIKVLDLNNEDEFTLGSVLFKSNSFGIYIRTAQNDPWKQTVNFYKHLTM